jgi:chromosome segregation ATPase
MNSCHLLSTAVRPDRHKWRGFSTLSGGQQALAALALSFSLQAVFPSPFYFFDEIDGSLDTKNARLIADHIKVSS